MRRFVAASLVVFGLAGACPERPDAQAPRHVKVAIEFRRAAVQSRDAVQGSGRVVITEKRGAHPSGRLQADSRTTRVEESTGVFTVVQDGGEAALTVATQIPYPKVAFYQDYATGAGYVAQGVAFRDVGTSLQVRAAVLPGNQVRVRLTPMISYLSADGAATIEFVAASTELVVPSGRPVILGGTATSVHDLTRQILGFSERQGGSETTVVLTATVQ